MTIKKFNIYPYSVIIVVLTLLFNQPAQGAIKTGNPITVSGNSFENGLHVIQHYRPFSQSVTLQMVVDVGLKEFPCNLQQTPHVLEHMLTSETVQFPEGEMRKTIKGLGGSLGAYTLPEYTHYSINIHSDYLSTGLDILYSMMFEPSLSQKNLQKSITAVHAELGTTDNALKNLINNKPSVKALGVSRLYANSNLECNQQSSPSPITLSHAQNTHSKFYQPGNMTLIIVGEFDKELLAHETSRLFNGVSNEQTNYITDKKPIIPLTTNSSPIIEHNKFSESAVHVNLLLPAVGKSNHRNAEFHLISDYLGEKLYYDLRADLGIAYSPRAHYIAGSDLGHVHAVAETTPEWANKVTEHILLHYQTLREQSIPSDDILRLKNKAILKFESKERTNLNIAQLIRHHRAHIKKEGDMPNLVNNIQNITAESVKEVIGTYFPEQPVLATLRPLNNKELASKLLLVILVSSIIALPLLFWLRKRRLAKAE